MVGKLARTSFPPSLQRLLNKAFIAVTKIDLSDFEPVESYPSIQALFTRSLKSPRHFSKDAATVIVPTDSAVVQFGDIREGEILQVKGLSYELAAFLTTEADAEKVQKVRHGHFINFYLAPHDYHHFHAPLDFWVHAIIHVPGTLFPVNKRYQEKQQDLFIHNERVILEATTKDGKAFYFVAIGALNVGSIKITAEPRVHTNLPETVGPTRYRYTTPLHIQKGADVGFFEMGSSTVLLFEKDSFHFDPSLAVGNPIRFGDALGKLL